MLSLAACADDEGAPFTGDDPTQVPDDPDQLRDWASRRGYRSWEAESERHDSAGPHFGDVRTYVNQALGESLAAGNAEHPVGAAAVKELFGGGQDLRGVAIMLKTEPGDDGDAWYWYERYDGETYADGQGDTLCTGCHSQSPDFVLTDYPLR